MRRRGAAPMAENMPAKRETPSSLGAADGLGSGIYFHNSRNIESWQAGETFFRLTYEPLSTNVLVYAFHAARPHRPGTGDYEDRVEAGAGLGAPGTRGAIGASQIAYTTVMTLMTILQR